MIPDAPDRTKYLKPHFTGFFGLYWRISLYNVFVGIICSSIACSIASSRRMQFSRT